VYAELKPFKIGLCIRDIAETLPTLFFPSKTAGYDETRADRPSSAPQWRTISVHSLKRAAPGTCTDAPFFATAPFWPPPAAMVDWPPLPALPGPPVNGSGKPMLHKVLMDTVGSQAARLLSSEHGLPVADVEKQLKAMLQSALSRLDVVSREEFQTQQTVLLRTRERLEALEKRVAELESRPSSRSD